MRDLDYASDYVRGVAAYWLPTWMITVASWGAAMWSLTPWDIILACVLIIIDFTLGTWHSLREKVFAWKRARAGIDKAGFKAIVLAASFTLYGAGNPILDMFGKFVVAGIVVLEIRSVIRNLDALTSERISFFRWLLSHIDRFDFRQGLKGVGAKQKPGTPLDIDEDGSTIRLHGSIDCTNVEPLREKVKDALDRHGRVVFDVSDVQFIDSTGFSFLLTAIKHAVMNGLARTDIIFLDPSHKTMRTLTLMGLDQLVNVKFTAPTPAEAIPPADVP